MSPSDQNAAPTEGAKTRHAGIVKQYLSDKGFGFIDRYGEPDLFFHITALETPDQPPAIGERVSFEIVPSRKKPGTFAAANMRREPDETPG